MILAGRYFHRLPLTAVTTEELVQLQEPPSIAGSRLRLDSSGSGFVLTTAEGRRDPRRFCRLTNSQSGVSWALLICLPAPLEDQRLLDLLHRTEPLEWCNSKLHCCSWASNLVQ